jgi:hypothetical protein
MSDIFSFAVDYIRSKIFKPKDYFERSKRKLVRSAIIPLFFIVGTPSIALSILANFRFIDFTGWGVAIRMVGEASSDLLLLSISVVITFCFALGLNFMYASRLKETEKALAESRLRMEKEEACFKLVQEYLSLNGSGRSEEAILIGAFVARTYPDFISTRPEFVISMIKNGAGAHFMGREIEEQSKSRLSLSAAPAVES